MSFCSSRWSSSSENSFDREYESGHNCEDIEDYKPDGYHPVCLGDYIQDYLVIQKLGWGQFSTVWLVQDKTTKEYLACKILKSK